MSGETKLVRLLWADDDSYDGLDPLARRLERSKFRLRRVVDYVDAITALDSGSEFEAVLLDVILPHAHGSGSLAFDLGMTLGDRAAQRGVKSIVFLSVVRRDDVLGKYEQLKRDFPNVEFNYFDKTQLLEPNVFDDLAKCLRTTRDGGIRK